jgi:cbb3-type cytochrome oxidase cytochrome c subunit
MENKKMADNQDTLNQGSQQEAAPSLTPQDAFSAPEGQAQNNTASDVVNDVIGTPQEQTQVQPQQETPVKVEGQEAPNDNDQVRYQYWQSQAAKANAQVKEMQQFVPYIDYIKQNPQVLVQNQQAEAQPQDEPFPKAPEKPRKPRNFSREDALSDNKSDSARYLDDVDDWQDKMSEYNQLQVEYTNKKMQESMQEMNAREQRVREAQEAEARKQQQVGEISEYVSANHGLTPEQTQKFITDMSSPESVSMDNLVKLWLANEGIQSNAPMNAQPSPQFQQTQAAQQVPSPMGVMPGGQTEVQGNEADQLMDGMISDWKSKNPF